MSQAEGRIVYDRFRHFVADAVANREGARERYVKLADGFTLSADTEHEVADAGGIPGEWVRTPSSRKDVILLYLHGGGYVTGSAAAYRHMIADITRGTGATALAIDYALAPERPFPQGIEDAAKAYRFLLDSKIDPRRILLAGDSAGGGLAMALMLTLRDEGLPQPAAAWLISPLADMERSGESIESLAHLCPIAIPNVSSTSASVYLAGASPRDPRASPIHADLTGLPPLRIDVGSHESLLDDSIRLARCAAIADVHVDLTIWPGMVHIFPFFAPILEEGRAAIAAASAFLTRNLA